MHITDQQLKEYFLGGHIFSKEDLALIDQRALETQKNFQDTLISEGKMTLDELNKAKAKIIGIPFVTFGEEPIDFGILSLIPEPIARHHNIVSYNKSDTELEVAMLDVEDLNAIEFVKKKVGLKILPRLTTEDSIKKALLQYQKTLKAEFSDIIQREAGSVQVVKDEKSGLFGFGKGETQDDKKLAEDLPIIKIVDTLLSHAILDGASDIHIEPEETQVLVRYRIDGILRDVMNLPKETAPGIVARIKVLSNLKLDEKRVPQDGRFKIKNDQEGVSFRVSTLPTYYGEKIVMRLLRESVKGFTLEKLGFYGEGLERIHRATHQKTGMILATGPTGSGKSTTLYTILDIVNTPEVNISTVEDPIEYQMKRINQTQVRPDIGFTFATGLRALLRQDPDIVMVGEIRDNETASLAINAALTGHLVLSTIHTNSAAGAIPRFLDMGAEPFLLVSTLNTVIGQRLIRRIGPNKEEYILSADELKSLAEIVDLDRMLEILRREKIVHLNDTWKTIQFVRPKGGAHNTDAYQGRVGIHEVLLVTPTIKEMIIKGATSAELEEQGKKEGMITMLEDGIVQAVKGMTTIEEVLRVVSE